MAGMGGNGGRGVTGAGGDPKDDPIGEVDLGEGWVGGDPEGIPSRRAWVGMDAGSAGRAWMGVHAWVAGPVVCVQAGGHAWEVGPAGCVVSGADAVGRGI